MALRLSTALRNGLLARGSLKDLLDQGKLLIYSGPQPTTADDAVSGTLLATITVASGAFTAEVNSVGTVTLNSGSSGSIDTVTVNSIEIMGSATAYNTSLTQTAADIAAKINRNPKNKLFNASSSGAVVTITAVPGLGTLPNAWTLASTATTLAKTDAGMASGVNAANGLSFDNPSDGTLIKRATETWSGVAGADGTAGWFRFVASAADAGAADALAVYSRLDGAIATSGSDLNMSSTAVVNGATQTINSFSLTEPAQ